MNSDRILVARAVFAGQLPAHYLSAEEVVEVELEVVDHAKDYPDKEDTDKNVYFGVYFFEEKETRFIYSSILATKVCSPSFFKNHIDDGQAVFVKVKVIETSG